jgi:putative membrane-bound dehydrogenase-like protein
MNSCLTRGFCALIAAAAVIVLLQVDARAQMKPEAELASLRPAADLDVRLFASEPMVTNPAAIDVDTKGRVWVVEIEHYRAAAKGPPSEKIKVLEDTDGDGRADKVTVFYEGLFCPMSICVAGDKVFVATSPDLWVFEDKDGDLKADGPPKKLLTGFGGYNHDHGAHSLVLGPDHKWWMSHGDGGFDLKGTDGSTAKFKWGAVLRGELDGSKLETPMVNFRNPYEVCVNSFGEAFLSDNDNDGLQSTRICWLMEGGNYGWFGTPGTRAIAGTPLGELWHFRGYIPGNVPGTVLTGFGAPCGICFYEGDAFGPKLKNVPWHTDAGPAELRAYPHQPAGFGMKATQQVLLTAGDRYFRPDDVCTAPDGSVFVSDWYDGSVGGHAYNNPNQGRIFQIRPKGKTLARHEKPGPYENIEDAIEGLKSPNLATQFLARERLLAEKEKGIPALTAIVADEAEPNFQARALWVLDRIGGSARDIVAKQLSSSDSKMRALAVRILRRHGDECADKILPLAADKSPEVLREVLLAIHGIPGEKADAALATIARQYDGSDRYFLEAINIAASERKQKLVEQLASTGELPNQQISLLQLLDPKRAAVVFQRQLLADNLSADDARRLLYWACTASSPELGKTLVAYLRKDSVDASLREMTLNLLAGAPRGGQQMVVEDGQFTETLSRLLADKSLQASALRVIGSQRLSSLKDSVKGLIAANAADEKVRAAAIETLAQLSAQDSIPDLRALLDDQQQAVREAALKALVDLQDLKSAREILASNDDKYSARFRSDLANKMFMTSGGALALVKLIEDNKLSPDLKQRILGRGTRHPDANVRALFDEFVPAERRAQRLGEKFSANDILALDGDAKRGETVFLQSSASQCIKCHTVRGKGENLGPDLSMIGKKYERAALLETILEPSKAIAPEYVNHIVETTEGHVLSGFIAEKNDQEIVLKDLQGRLQHVPANKIESTTPQLKSVMPDLVLRDVSAQDAADLLAYLLTLK